MIVQVWQVGISAVATSPDGVSSRYLVSFAHQNRAHHQMGNHGKLTVAVIDDDIVTGHPFPVSLSGDVVEDAVPRTDDDTISRSDNLSAEAIVVFVCSVASPINVQPPGKYSFNQFFRVRWRRIRCEGHDVDCESLVLDVDVIRILLNRSSASADERLACQRKNQVCFCLVV